METMDMDNESAAQGSIPIPLDGAYVLHSFFKIDWSRWSALLPERKYDIATEATQVIDELTTFQRTPDNYQAGATFHVVGHKGDLLFLFFRNNLDDLVEIEHKLNHLRLWNFLIATTSYLSLVELSGHGSHIRYQRLLEKQGFTPGTPEAEQYLNQLILEDIEANKERLFPAVPPQKYLCFYPMNKRRGEHKNWFLLPSQERARLMGAHGKTGRKYHGKVIQIISSSMGLDDFDWAVDLFSDDPQLFKKLIYEMRFDEVSALYAEFGSFFIGVKKGLLEVLLPAAVDEKLP